MAKRMVRKGKRNSRKPAGNWFGRLGKWGWMACFVIGCFVASHYVYDYLREIPWEQLGPRKTETPAVEPAAVSRNKPKARKPELTAEKEKRTEGKAPVSVRQLEIPALKQKRTEQVIRHEGYTVSYNSDYRIANWVAYELTGQEAKSKKHARSNKFVPDPEVKGATAMNEDYSRSGFDKGHLAPAGDMKWSAKAMRESFYFSNICPQVPGLNRGIWRELEEQARLWASDNGVLYVVTGPVITDSMRRLGKNRVGVPVLFYKVLCTVTDGKYEAVGFLFENRDYGKKESLKKLMLPVDRVEEVTGIDFFPALPDEVERVVESRVNEKAWSY